MYWGDIKRILCLNFSHPHDSTYLSIYLYTHIHTHINVPKILNLKHFWTHAFQIRDPHPVIVIISGKGYTGERVTSVRRATHFLQCTLKIMFLELSVNRKISFHTKFFGGQDKETL
jgi:hypothetical protein